MTKKQAFVIISNYVHIYHNLCHVNKTNHPTYNAWKKQACDLPITSCYHRCLTRSVYLSTRKFRWRVCPIRRTLSYEWSDL